MENVLFIFIPLALRQINLYVINEMRILTVGGTKRKNTCQGVNKFSLDSMTKDGFHVQFFAKLCFLRITNKCVLLL